MDQLREFDNDLKRNNVYKNSNFMNSVPLMDPPREPYNRSETPNPNQTPKSPAPPPNKQQNYQNSEFNYNSNANQYLPGPVFL